MPPLPTNASRSLGCSSSVSDYCWATCHRPAATLLFLGLIIRELIVACCLGLWLLRLVMGLLIISVMIVGLLFVALLLHFFAVREDISEYMALADTIAGANIASLRSFFDGARRRTRSTSTWAAHSLSTKSSSSMASGVVRFGDLISSLRRR